MNKYERKKILDCVFNSIEDNTIEIDTMLDALTELWVDEDDFDYCEEVYNYKPLT